MLKGIVIKDGIGIGDGIQFTSLPENYFRATGEKLVDVNKSWFFDYNPFVIRDVAADSFINMWNFPQVFEWPRPRDSVYLSNAEIWASLFGVNTVLNRPRLYKFEDHPYKIRNKILFHTHGRSHGALSEEVIEHVISKYESTGQLYHVGLPTDPYIGIPKIETESLWGLASLISECKMFIGVDSGPSWIAACFPDVIIKKIKMAKVHGQKSLKDWVPLEIENFHSHWDDRIFQIYNPTGDDVGFTQSYKKL